MDPPRPYSRARQTPRVWGRPELGLLAPDADPADLSGRVRELNADYIRITANDIPLPNRFFDQASKRIEQSAAE